jgi:predicted 3-demethylubiquinone-9 3-methyltransferase (glyoxalase superfamily)
VPITQKITPFLWFNTEAEEAAEYYVSIFKNSRIVNVSRYTEVGQEFHHRPPGSAMVVSFELEGQPFDALNGGPIFHFNESVSLMIHCENQEEVDHYWNRLTEGGDPNAQQCGWLKDKFGLSWQVTPNVLLEYVNGPDSEGSKRAMQAMLQMKKLDIAELKRAYEG